nr:MAG TPA: hypothetical protein [Caudoviricetes sp.]
MSCCNDHLKNFARFRSYCLRCLFLILSHLFHLAFYFVLYLYFNHFEKVSKFLI